MEISEKQQFTFTPSKMSTVLSLNTSVPLFEYGTEGPYTAEEGWLVQVKFQTLAAGTLTLRGFFLECFNGLNKQRAFTSIREYFETHLKVIISLPFFTKTEDEFLSDEFNKAVCTPKPTWDTVNKLSVTGFHNHKSDKGKCLRRRRMKDIAQRLHELGLIDDIGHPGGKGDHCHSIVYCEVTWFLRPISNHNTYKTQIAKLESTVHSVYTALAKAVQFLVPGQDLDSKTAAILFLHQVKELDERNEIDYEETLTVVEKYQKARGIIRLPDNPVLAKKKARKRPIEVDKIHWNIVPGCTIHCPNI